jgi:hypothetical protein
MLVNSGVAEQLAASQEGLSNMELDINFKKAYDSVRSEVLKSFMRP